MLRRSRPLAAFLTLGLCLVLAACSSGAGEEVTARTTPDGVVATNHATRAATYFVIDPTLLPSITLVDCTQPGTGCPRIEPGQTITIPWRQITGDLARAERYELWWSLVGTPARAGKIELTWSPAVP